jgi:CRP/FNR family transcriptional regulator, cyclic AMP receptor protein
MKRRTPVSTTQVDTVLESIRESTRRYAPHAIVFAQGDACAGVMHVDRGRVQLTARSPEGREAVLAVLGPGAFFGEGALAGQRHRKSTATAIKASRITRIRSATMRRGLRHDVVLSAAFRRHLLTTNARIEADVASHLLNSAERRLAGLLLLLARVDECQAERYALPLISRALLAEMIGGTHARVNLLMNRFRKLGFLERHSARAGGLHVHRSMLSLVLQG